MATHEIEVSHNLEIDEEQLAELIHDHMYFAGMLKVPEKELVPYRATGSAHRNEMLIVARAVAEDMEFS